MNPEITNFNSFREFLNSLCDAIESPEYINVTVIEGGGFEVHDYSEERSRCYFTDDEYSVNDILVTLIQMYGSNLEFECGWDVLEDDEDDIQYRYLNISMID